MATTLQVAVDEIYGRLKTVWDAQTPAILGASPAAPVTLLYEDTEWKGRPDDATADPWARASIRHASGQQATLADSTSRRLFRNYGAVTVQCFAPMRDNRGAPVARQLAEVVKAAFEGARTSNVWFQSVRFNEIGREGLFFQLNVVANFEWDEAR